MVKAVNSQGLWLESEVILVQCYLPGRRFTQAWYASMQAPQTHTSTPEPLPQRAISCFLRSCRFGDKKVLGTQLSLKHCSEALWSCFFEKSGVELGQKDSCPGACPDSTQQPELGALDTAAPNPWRELARLTAHPLCPPQLLGPSPLLA